MGQGAARGAAEEPLVQSRSDGSRRKSEKSKKEKKEHKHHHRTPAPNYETFPEAPPDYRDGFLWEKEARPWSLLTKAGIAVGKNVCALLILFWTLLTQREYLMICDGRHLHIAMVYGCEYTKAYLRSFPLLAVNVTLVVAMRILVQQRMYYGFLKVGGLLDFTNSKQTRDVLFWILAVSLLHGCVHFGLKASVWPGGLEDVAMWMSIGQHFLVPAFIFMIFFYTSCDIEKNLIPLNKYFEEDHEYAQRALRSITPMNETILRYDVMNRDTVGEADDYTIEATYANIIQNYPAAVARIPPAELERKFMEFHLFKAMWPAPVLLDPRLHDPESLSFRMMFLLFACTCSVIQGMSVVAFSKQAYKDVVIDYWYGGQTEDITSFLVVSIHWALVLWIFTISLRAALTGRCCACCGYRAKEEDE